MTHDPLCPTFMYPDDHCQCARIARVREDERGNRVYAAHNVMASEHANGYAKGRADAADAVAALLSWEESNSEVTFHAIDRDAAITAARGGTDE